MAVIFTFFTALPPFEMIIAHSGGGEKKFIGRKVFLFSVLCAIMAKKEEKIWNVLTLFATW
jgi:hypothetical protein